MAFVKDDPMPLGLEYQWRRGISGGRQVSSRGWLRLLGPLGVLALRSLVRGKAEVQFRICGETTVPEPHRVRQASPMIQHLNNIRAGVKVNLHDFILADSLHIVKFPQIAVSGHA